MGQYLLLRHREIPNLHQLDVYRAHGGFEAFRKAVTSMTPADVLAAVKNSGLRGRGGAGFPTGMKWAFLPNDRWPHYVVANADESEPGTFKDRELLESNPYQFLEGLMLASYAVQANQSYVYLRGEFWALAQKLDGCIAELEKAGLLGENLFGTAYHLRLATHLGAGAYICGEETALLESLEGKLGQPRLRPPFPATHGLYNSPTVVNNVETLANVPLIVEHGPDWYRSFGTEKSPGVKIFSLSGCVNKPGNYELPLGTPFRELIFQHGGGIPNGGQVKAFMSAGASSTIVAADDAALDTPMDYESTQNNLNAPLGSASVIILDDTVNMADLVQKTVHFFKHESCGKCTPCREGTFWMNRLATRIAAGQGSEKDVDLLAAVARQMQGKCLCALGEFSTMAVVSGIEKFREDFLHK
ncbi:NADH-quinone oxidoreductase subunit NuoF [Levilinea saccharolytica]|uniref:NADH dehydrogenase n=1 Tax=Levilinea saccharolytica TaxID=229921 RepID=A0A0P6XIC4_9CHLR|nr:NADH-quinone oxidoreductase subunit NuoF [Levilinea saccharolytica]KPL79852.1 NADH dehydrogenase [Levilinea saccharolytica]KPL79867.1 NADH dehydrogenase [Levilinea saccharolytica]GAP16879.1 NADH dehydrogenase subunit F [Levilinea saccharolytica]